MLHSSNPCGSDVTIVTTCMQRLSFLKKTLPSWVRHTSFRILVVDYSCPEGTAEWLESSSFSDRITVVRCEAQTIKGRPVFNPSRARNAGAAAAETEWLLFLDADVQVEEGFETWILENLDPKAMLAFVGRPSPLYGFLGVGKSAFESAGRYDEGFTGWGGEDLDLRIRLYLWGLKCRALPGALVRSLPHSNHLRARNSAEPEFSNARMVNEKYLNRKLLRLTGRKFGSWWNDPTVDCLARRPE